MSANLEASDSATINDQVQPNLHSNNINNSLQDLVIRDGFPALRLPNGQPNVEGDELIPRVVVETTTITLNLPLQALWDDCELVFGVRTRQNGSAYSIGTTYFWPCALPPRCAIEALVASIFQYHTAHLDPSSYVTEQSGAEWWTLVLSDEDTNTNTNTNNAVESTRDNMTGTDKGGDGGDDTNDTDEEEDSDEVGLHFDADFGLEAQAPNLLLHPRLATVTYLTNTGVPTVVLNKRSPPPNDTEKTTLHGSIQKAWLSHPVLGKHLAFDGRLLHGAPSTFFPSQHKILARPSKKARVNEEEKQPSKRITLLVNIWLNHCPLDAEPLEDEVVQKMHPHSTENDEMKKEVCKWSFERKTCFPQVSLHLSATDPAGSEEMVIGNRMVVAHYGATMHDFHSASQESEHDSIELSLEKGVIELEVGDCVSSEDEVIGEDNDDDDYEKE